MYKNVILHQACVSLGASSSSRLLLRSFVKLSRFWSFLKDVFLQKSDAMYVHQCEHIIKYR